MSLLVGPQAKLLPFVVHTKALGVLIEARKASGFFIGSDAFHFDDFGTGEDVGELDGAPAFLLISNDLKYVFFHGVTLRDILLMLVALIRILVSAYM